jgi:hypothetical protein
MRSKPDDDLVLCPWDGVAYQADMTPTAAYDETYFAKCASYEGQAIADKINAGRVELVNDFIGMNRCCDIGIGSGEFIKHRGNTWGCDVNPVAIEWLRKIGRLADNLNEFAAFTFWDVLEHIPTPEDYLKRIPLHGFVFTSVPIMATVERVRESKHYRPGEHLYYWEMNGFVDWMAMHGFKCVSHRTFEIDAGRDSIHSFGFKRFKWAPMSSSK